MAVDLDKICTNLLIYLDFTLEKHASRTSPATSAFRACRSNVVFDEPKLPARASRSEGHGALGRDADNDARRLEHRRCRRAGGKAEGRATVVGDDGGEGAAARKRDDHLAIDRARLDAGDGAGKAIARRKFGALGGGRHNDRRRLDQGEHLGPGLKPEFGGAVPGDDGDDFLAAGNCEFDFVIDRAPPVEPRPL